MSALIMIQHAETQTKALCAAINVLSEYLLREGISQASFVALQTVCMEAGAHVPLSEVTHRGGKVYLDEVCNDV